MSFRSSLEARIAKTLGKKWDYEPEKVPYVIKATYTPDFVRGKIVVEVKGFFRGADKRKYLAIRDALEAEGRELVFVFQKPHAKTAKGLKETYAQWAEKHGIRWFDEETVGELNDLNLY